MADTLSTLLIVALVVVATVGVVLLGVIGFVIWRYDVPLSGIVAMFGALIYLLSPVDAIPEGLFGPFGLVDDAGVVGATVLFVYKLVTARRMLAARGVQFPPARRRPGGPGEPRSRRPPELPPS